MTALDTLLSDLDYARALKAALIANAENLPDLRAREEARRRAEDVYRLNAAHANQIYYHTTEGAHA